MYQNLTTFNHPRENLAEDVVGLDSAADEDDDEGGGDDEDGDEDSDEPEPRLVVGKHGLLSLTQILGLGVANASRSACGD